MAAKVIGDELYATLKSDERFKLALEAMARQDKAEVDRLGRSCPRFKYTMSDADFHDAIDLSHELALIVGVEFQRLGAHLRTFRWVRELIEPVNRLHVLTATQAFDEGVRCGRGEGQSVFFLEEDERNAALARPSKPGKAKPLTDAQLDDLARRWEAVERHAEVHAAEVTAAAWVREVQVARELAVVWVAFGRFCRERLGIEPAVLVNAWGVVADGEVEGLLAEYPQLKPPDPERVEWYFGRLGVLWGRRFAGT